METEIGQLLTHWSARVAVGCYLLRLAIDAGLPKDARFVRLARWFWTIGCGCYLLHVALAFQFYHAWSHRAAYEHTARRTAEIAGIHWGGGLYVNYLFTAVWVADTAFWWRRGDARREHPAVYWSLQSFFGVMMFTATVVFGPPFWTVVGLIVAATLVWLSIRRTRVSANSRG